MTLDLEADRLAKRWVVTRAGHDDAKTWFYFAPGNHVAFTRSQRDAYRFLDRVDALNVASNTGGKVHRLVPRAEAVERASRAAYLRAMEDVRGYLAQVETERVYVADVTDEIDRLAKEHGNG